MVSVEIHDCRAYDCIGNCKPQAVIFSTMDFFLSGVTFVMKKLLISLIMVIAAFSTSIAGNSKNYSYTPHEFERAVQIIKKYETLHSAKHWPLVGYGHKVQPGENFRRGQALSEKQADELLRKDLKKLINYYSSYGKDSLLLGVLAYNVGSGRVNKSSVVSLLKSGNRNIRDAFTSMCRYKGRVHKTIQKRRIEEFTTLFRH